MSHKGTLIPNDRTIHTKTAVTLRLIRSEWSAHTRWKREPGEPGQYLTLWYRCWFGVELQLLPLEKKRIEKGTEGRRRMLYVEHSPRRNSDHVRALQSSLVAWAWREGETDVGSLLFLLTEESGREFQKVFKAESETLLNFPIWFAIPFAANFHGKVILVSFGGNLSAISKSDSPDIKRPRFRTNRAPEGLGNPANTQQTMLR